MDSGESAKPSLRFKKKKVSEGLKGKNEITGKMQEGRGLQAMDQGIDARRNHAGMWTPNKSESRGCWPWDIGGATLTGQVTTLVFKK